MTGPGEDDVFEGLLRHILSSEGMCEKQLNSIQPHIHPPILSKDPTTTLTEETPITRMRHPLHLFWI